jgi:hypothetical protein
MVKEAPLRKTNVPSGRMRLPQTMRPLLPNVTVPYIQEPLCPGLLGVVNE